MTIKIMAMVALTGLVVIASTAVALAVGGGIEFRLYPADGETQQFIYDLLPGSVIEDTFAIANYGAEPVTLRLYAADGYTAATGGIVVERELDPRDAMGAWIELDRDTVTIAPGTAVEVGFALRVPDDAEAGKHAAGIVAQNEEVTIGTSALSVASVQRSVLLVLGTTPGELVSELVIDAVEQSFSNGRPMFGIEIRNPGTNYVYPKGHIQIEDRDGVIVQRRDIKFGMFLPGTSVDHRSVMDEVLLPGKYVVDIEFDYGGDEPARYRSEFEVTNEELRQAAVEALQLSEARGKSPPIIIIQESGIDQNTLAAGVSVIALAGSVLWLTNRIRRNTRKREDELD